MEIFGIFILAGLLAGFMAGLLGIGGGFVLVPVLLLALPQVGIAEAQVTHFAIATSLLCICVTSVVSTVAHQRKKAILWSLVALITPGLILGAFAGAALASQISGDTLTLLFVCGAACTALYLLSEHQPNIRSKEHKALYLLYGTFTGTVSSLVGIGGGSLLVPFLVHREKSMIKSVATAAACGFPIALCGAAAYAITGMQKELNYPMASGYLYWPAFFGIVIFSSLSAPIGAKIAHKVGERNLRKAFALFLILTCAQILYSRWF